MNGSIPARPAATANGRSMPAENQPPAPRRTTTRTSLSRRARSSPASSPSSTAPSMALRLSGRLIVSVITPAATSTSSASPLRPIDHTGRATGESEPRGRCRGTPSEFLCPPQPGRRCADGAGDTNTSEEVPMINGVGCSNAAAGAAPMTAAGGLNQADRDQMLSSTADLLNMSVTDLKSKLASGQSLDDIAQTQGVSHDDLVANIVSNLKSQGATGAGRADASLTTVANRIAGHHRHHGHHRAEQAPAAGSSPAPSATTGSTGVQ